MTHRALRPQSVSLLLDLVFAMARIGPALLALPDPILILRRYDCHTIH